MKILIAIFLLSITCCQVLSNRSKRGIPAVFDKTVLVDQDVPLNDDDVTIDCDELGVTIHVSQSKIQTFIPLYADGISGYVFVGSDDDLIPGCNGSISGDGSINVFFSSATDCSFSATNVGGDVFSITYKLCLTPDINTAISYVYRDSFVVIDLACAFENGILANNFGLTPRISKVPVAGESKRTFFKTDFWRCQNSSCIDEYSSGIIYVGDVVYFKAVIPRGEENSLILQLWKCWATPDSNPNTTPKFDIIIDGCPNEEVPAVGVMVPLNFMSTEVQFSFKSFAWTHQFLSNIQKIYIHCIFCYCKEDFYPEGNCTTAPDCGIRRRRSINIPSENQKRITVGPIQYKMPPCDKEKLGCSHECSYDGSGTAGCSCPTGFFLEDDLKTCKAFEKNNFEEKDDEKIIFLSEQKIIPIFDHMIFIWYLLFSLTILAVCGAIGIGCRSWKRHPINSKVDGVTFI